MEIRQTATFRVREDELDEVLEAIRAFVAHTRTEPGTLRYESWRSLDRPTEFLHLMAFADDEAERAHGTSAAVKLFTDILYPRCEEGPAFERWSLVD
ncbi:MAG TPA: antibiotic biosynthesis monooxygenase family protein [Actinomycetota bacterium]|jgi:quinol monooxygenase YgiN|nr:antibiotic biosynthesis monooxygenase family protein [Actinomycetota bacterium]